MERPRVDEGGPRFGAAAPLQEVTETEPVLTMFSGLTSVHAIDGLE